VGGTHDQGHNVVRILGERHITLHGGRATELVDQSVLDVDHDADDLAPSVRRHVGAADALADGVLIRKNFVTIAWLMIATRGLPSTSWASETRTTKGPSAVDRTCVPRTKAVLCAKSAFGPPLCANPKDNRAR
jgi:hypothetical protein